MATSRRRKSDIIPFLDDPERDGHWAGLVVLALALVTVGWVVSVWGQDQGPKVAEPKTTAAQGPIADDNDPRVKAAVARAAAFLRSKGTPALVGELSLSINALAKIRSKYPDLVAAGDPVLKEMVEALRVRCVPEFRPTRQGGQDNYEAGCAAMALAAVNRNDYAAEQTNIAKFILNKQLPNGSWSYDAVPTGDTSMTQYALLGLWEANNAGGGPIPKEAWDKAAKWLLTRQSAGGGYAYHPLDPGPAVIQPEATHTMTVASLGSLYLCRDHLPGGKRRDNRGVLLPIEPDPPADKFKAQVKPETLKNAIDAATKWLVDNFTLDKAKGEGDPGGGRWVYYYLYAFERFATLADLKTIRDVDWYSKAAGTILARQQANGSWIAGNEDIVDTSFAVLFLVRSTKLIIGQPKLLGGGTLESLDFSKLASRGRIRDLFVVDSAAAEKAGEESKRIKPSQRNWDALGPKAAGPWKELEKGYAAKESIRIIVALNDLALTHDVRVVPLLIDAMYYEDSERVMLAARESLCFISRRIEGPYTGATADDWEKEIAKWKAWYRSVRPQADVEDDVVLK